MRKSAIALLLILTVIFSQAGTISAQSASQAKYKSKVTEYDPLKPTALVPDNLYAETSVLIDYTTGRVLFEADKDKKMYPASTTKVLTALIALENLDMDDTITVSSEALKNTEPTWMELRSGEEIKVRDLLYPLLLHSANDAASALAVHLGGSLEGFAQMMNERAAQIGCLNSNFVVPHGLPSETHYSTAYDMALIAREAMKNETFREIVVTPTYTVQPTNKFDKVRNFTNSDKFLADSGSDYSYEYAIGVKTGYTSKAESAFIGAAQKDGVTLISVVLGTSAEGKWVDSKKLMDYGFASVVSLDIAKQYNIAPVYINVQGALDEDTTEGLIKLVIENESDPTLFSYIDTKMNIGEIEKNFSQFITIKYEENRSAPITKGQVMATMYFKTVDMDAPIEVPLVSENEVRAKPVPTPAPGQDISEYVESGGSKEFSLSSYIGYLLLIPSAILLLLAFIVFFSAIRGGGKRRRKAAKAQQRRPVPRNNTMRRY